MSVVLVTGANGFMGQSLCHVLEKASYSVRRTVRYLEKLDEASPSWEPGNGSDGNSPATDESKSAGPAAGVIAVKDIGPYTDWFETLEGVGTVVHLAGRTHVLYETESDPITAFRHVNTLGTERLARQAAAAGVSRFVYVSSIKVNGEKTGGAPFTEVDDPVPVDPYAISKWEAELILRKVANETGLEVVVVRPPLVYGPGVKANFLRLLRWVDRGVPLPLGSLDNRRSLVALDNLVNLLVRCVEHPGAAGETFLVSDGEDLSTSELIRRIATQMGRPARLIPFPPGLIRLAAGLLGKTALSDRLCGSLQVDIGKARKVLGWKPPVSVDEGLARTVEWYKNEMGDS